jgi:hypothetical protein
VFDLKRWLREVDDEEQKKPAQAFDFKWDERSEPYRAHIEAAEDKYGMPRNLLARMINQESTFNPNAVSPKGAKGLMQIMPEHHPKAPFGDPIAEIDYGANYLAQNAKAFGKDGQPDWRLGLGAYNAGPGTVRKHGGLPPFAETQNHVRRIYDEGLLAQAPDPGLRPDGTAKGKGFLGEMQRPDGKVSTELSIGVGFDGKETQIPLLVPTLTKQETDALLRGEKAPEAVVTKAVEHAKQRMSEGKSPFADDTESPAPQQKQPFDLAKWAAEGSPKKERFDLAKWLQEEDAPAAPKEKPGLIKGTLGSMAGGVIDLVEMYGRAGRAMPGGERAGLDQGGLGSKIINWAEKFRKDNPNLDHAQREGFSRWWHEGVRSAVTSIAAGLPGAAAGALLGSTFGPGGTLAGGIIGFATGGGTLFGISQYDDALEAYREAGVSMDKAEPAAIREGLYEGGFEFLSDIIGGFLVGGKILTVAGKEALRQGVGSMFKAKLKDVAKRFAGIAAAEVSTEMVTSGLQAEERHALGVGDERFVGAAIDAFGPSLVASLIFGGLGEFGRRRVSGSIKKTLADPQAVPADSADAQAAFDLANRMPGMSEEQANKAIEALSPAQQKVLANIQERLGAAQMVANEIKTVDEGVAGTWFNTAAKAILNGESIDLDAPIATDAQLDARIDADHKLAEMAVEAAAAEATRPISEDLSLLEESRQVDPLGDDNLNRNVLEKIAKGHPVVVQRGEGAEALKEQIRFDEALDTSITEARAKGQEAPYAGELVPGAPESAPDSLSQAGQSEAQPDLPLADEAQAPQKGDDTPPWSVQRYEFAKREGIIERHFSEKHPVRRAQQMSPAELDKLSKPMLESVAGALGLKRSGSKQAIVKTIMADRAVREQLKDETVESLQANAVDVLRDMVQQLTGKKMSHLNKPQLAQQILQTLENRQARGRNEVAAALHKLSVQKAVKEGKPVSDTILEPYVEDNHPWAKKEWDRRGNKPPKTVSQMIDEQQKWMPEAHADAAKQYIASLTDAQRTEHAALIEDIEETAGTRQQFRPMNALAEATGTRKELSELLGRVLTDAKKAFDTKSPEADTPAPTVRKLDKEVHRQAKEDLDAAGNSVQHELVSAAQGVAVGHQTGVDRAFDEKKNHADGDKIYAAFEKTRQSLRQKYGDTIALVRLQGDQALIPNKTTLNWVYSDKLLGEFQEMFNGLGEKRKVVKRDVPIEDIVAVNVGKGRYEEFVVLNRDSDSLHYPQGHPARESAAPPANAQTKMEKAQAEYQALVDGLSERQRTHESIKGLILDVKGINPVLQAKRIQDALKKLSKADKAFARGPKDVFTVKPQEIDQNEASWAYATDRAAMEKIAEGDEVVAAKINLKNPASTEDVRAQAKAQGVKPDTELGPMIDEVGDALKAKGFDGIYVPKGERLDADFGHTLDLFIEFAAPQIPGAAPATLSLNGKTYRPTGKSSKVGGKDVGHWEYEYKGKWVPIKSIPIRLQADKALAAQGDTGQRRAKAGGEFGANGEWYEGGKFIANTDHPKSHKKWEKPTGKQEVDNGQWSVPPETADNIFATAIFRRLGGIETRNPDGTFSLNPDLKAEYASKEAIEAREELIEAWNKGARWSLVAVSADGKRTPLNEFMDSEGKKIPAEAEIEITGSKNNKVVTVDMPAKQADALSPKEQKKYLLAEIDAALAAAPAKVEGEAAGTVTIEVPGDGEFIILNTKEALASFKERAVKDFPDKLYKAPKKGKPTGPKATGKRLTWSAGQDFSYYNPFQVREEGIVELHSIDSNKKIQAVGYRDGFFTDGAYVIKTDQPAKTKSELRTGDQAPAAQEVIDRLSKRKDGQEAQIVGEFVDAVIETLPLAHLTAGNLDVFVKAQYVDSILTAHPNATVTVFDTKSPVLFTDKGEVVGLIAPVGQFEDGLPDTVIKGHARVAGKTEAVKAESVKAEKADPVSVKNHKAVAKELGVKAKQAYTAGDLEASQYMVVVDLLARGDVTAVQQIIDALYPVSPNLASRTTKVRGKADVGRLIKMLGAQMYQGNLAEVTIKETVQNAFDAVKASLAVGKIKEGKIDILTMPEQRIIAIRDNGQGMTKKVITDAFLTVAGTSKEGLKSGEASGGFGMAKAAFLYGNEWISVTTTKGGKTYRFKARGDELLSKDINIAIEDAAMDEHGTVIIIKVPETVVSDGETRDVWFPHSAGSISFFRKPLLNDNIEIRSGEFGLSLENIDTLSDPKSEQWKEWTDYYSRTIPVGKNFDRSGFEKNTTAKFAWGHADIYIGVARKKGYDIQHTVLSAGIYQFDHRFESEPFKSIPYDIIVDVFPTAAAEAPSYPFNIKREGWKATISKDIEALAAYLKGVAMGIEAQGTVETFKNVKSLPQVEIDDVGSANIDISEFLAPPKKAAEGDAPSVTYKPPAVTVGEGKVTGQNQAGETVTFVDTEKQKEQEKAGATFKADKELPSAKDFLIDTGIDDSNAIYHNNTNIDYIQIAKDAGYSAETMFAELGSIMLQMKKILAEKGGYAYSSLKDPAQSVFVGISVDKRYYGVNTVVPFRAILLNPLAISHNTLPALAHGYYHTAVHEFAHVAQRNHNESFIGEQDRLLSALAADGTDLEIRMALSRVLKKHKDLISLLRNEYEKSTTRNVAKALDEAQGDDAVASRRRADGPDGSADPGAGNVRGTGQTGTKPRAGDNVRGADQVGQEAVTLLAVRQTEPQVSLQQIKESLKEADYVEQGKTQELVRGVPGGDTVLSRGVASEEAATQIANLYADRFRRFQTISTIADAQQWLQNHKFPRIAPAGQTRSLIERLLQNKAFLKLSIFDRVRIAAQLERPIREKDYSPRISPQTNRKLSGTQGIRDGQNQKVEGSGIIAADTVAGCDHYCYECYALKGTAQAQISHQHPVKVQLNGILKTGETFRLGEKGDASKDWAHTHQQISALLERSQKNGQKVTADDIFFITKLLNVDGFNPQTARNLQVTLDPLYPDHMWRSMQNIIRIKAAHPEVNISARIRSLHSKNQDLNDSTRAAVSFANEFGLPILETRMRFIRKASFDLLQLDADKYKYVNNQFKPKTPALKEESKDYNLCDSAEQGCPGCKSCIKLLKKRDVLIPRQMEIIKGLGIDGVPLPGAHEYDPVGFDKKGKRTLFNAAPGTDVNRRALTTKSKATAKNVIRVADMVAKTLRRSGIGQEAIDRISVELKDVIDLRGKNIEQTVEQWASRNQSISAILGATTIDNLSAVIELSLEQDLNSIERTTFHEAFHVAAKWLLPKSDYARLMEFYKGNEETAADAFADYMQGRSEATGVVRRIMYQLRDFFRKMGSYLRGEGFSRPEDIFGDIAGGKYQMRHNTGMYQGSALAGQSKISFKEESRAPAWYSQLQKVLEAKLPGSATPAQLKELIKAWEGEFKSEELAWVGLNEWLDNYSKISRADYRDQRGKEMTRDMEAYGALDFDTEHRLLQQINREYDERMASPQKITKQQVLDFVAANNVQLKEVTRDDKDPPRLDDLKKQKADLIRRMRAVAKEEETPSSGREYDDLREQKGLLDLEINRVEAESAERRTRHSDSQYQLPGGENYREIILTMPRQIDPYTPDSTHFTDEGGGTAIVWVRANDRFPNNEKTLHLEEVQSKRHQDGREQGYVNDYSALEKQIKTAAEKNGADMAEVQKAIDHLKKEPIDTKKRPTGWAWKALSDATQGSDIDLNAFHDIREHGVPDAPYKGSKNWAMLAIRRMVRMAAEQGYEAITWTTGETQAERYNLSKHVDRIESVGRTDARTGEESRHITIVMRGGSHVSLGVGGNGVIDNSRGADLKGKHLSDVIGKEMAGKILDGPVTEEYSGEGLKVGGEGMKGFYDKILVAEANRFFGKKAWGNARVGTTQIDTGAPREADLWGYDNYEQEIEAAEEAKQHKGMVTVHRLPITPEMRQKALSEGMTLFKLAESNDPTHRVTDLFNRAHPGHKVRYDGIQEMGAINRPDMYHFTALDGPAKGASFMTAEAKPSLIKAKLDEMIALRQNKPVTSQKGPGENIPTTKTPESPKGGDAYKGAHRPVTVDGGAARLHDLEPAFGEDIYTKNAIQYFGTGEDTLDRGTVKILQSLRGNPGKEILVFRAVPKDAPSSALTEGDWVTVNKQYAIMHGESALGGDYKIISQKVKAKDLTTNADSFHEQGYYPTPNQSSPRENVGKTLLKVADTKKADTATAIFPAEVAGQIRASRGLNRKGPLKERMAAWIKDAIDTFTPGNIFPTLKGKDFAKATEILRHATEISSYSRWRAEQDLREILNPAKMRPGQYDLMTYKILVDDMLYDIETEGRPLFDWKEKHGELPFGFKDEAEVRDALAKIDERVEADKTVQEALKRRQDLMQKLRGDLVEAKLLDRSVLADPRYYHHEVLKYANLKRGAGTSSKDMRVHKKGYQLHRVGSIEQYNTEYAQAEFEVLAQGIAQLEMKKSLDEVDAEYNIIGQLRTKARGNNYIAVVGGLENFKRLEKLRGEKAEIVGEGGHLDADEKMMVKAINEEIWALDPTMPYRAKIAMGMAKMAKTGAPPGSRYDQLFEPEGADFAQIAELADKGDMGAAIVLKAVSERKKFIQDALGSKYVTWQDLMKEHKPLEGSAGWADWKPRPGSAWYKTNTINDRVLEQVLAGQKELTDKDVRQVLVKGYDVQWVIPAELAEVLDGTDFLKAKPENVVAQAAENTLNWWKRWILMNPFRFFKYNLNNLSGDADIAFAYNPKMLAYAKQAAQDLWKIHYNKPMSKELKAEFDEAMRNGIIASGMTVQDIPDITDSAAYDQIMAAMRADKPKAIEHIKRFWGGTKNFTVWRENILRLAAYRFFKAELKKGKKMYGASIPAQVDATTDLDRKAALLARELIGDYGKLSRGGQWLRKKMIPFYSWQEINAPRYWRIFKNLPIEGEKGARLRVGGVLGKKAAVAAAKMATFYTMVQMWNHLVWPDEEEELGESGRRQMHLILGRREDGSIITLRIQGAFSDALSWIGLEDGAQDLHEVRAGHKPWHSLLTDAAMAPAEKLVQGARPDIKVPVELLTGKSLFPDMTKPRPIRDGYEHMARTFSLDPIYRHLSGKPVKGGSLAGQILTDLSNVFTYTSDPGEQAYHGTRSLVQKYMDVQGIERPMADPTNKGNAIYYYKRALQYGDGAAAEKYLEKYRELGGNWKSLHESIKRSHPLAALPPAHRMRFMAWADSDGRRSVAAAINWYNKVYRGGQ